MKLKNIKIENLFGLEQNNFDIELYPEENVTLLYGFNGVGKTSIIKLIAAVVQCDLKKLRNLVSKVELTFEDGSKLFVTKTSDEDLRRLRTKSRKENTDFYHPIIYKEIDSDGNEKLHTFRIVGSEIHIAHEYRYPELIAEESIEDLKDLQKKLMRKVDLHVIYGNRDYNRLSEPEIFGDRVFFHRENPNKIQMMYSIDQAEKIINSFTSQIRKLKEKNSVYIELDSEILKGTRVTEDMFVTYEMNVPDKLTELVEKVTDVNGQLLNAYKIFLFEDVINNKLGLLYKNVKLSESGLQLENIYNDDPEITLGMLSSGEKNLLCLFLELIFLTNENSVLFLDEPETSLHVEWQSHLVECILEICKKLNIQVIIATHAPEIVGDYDGITNEIQSERFQNGAKYFDN